MYSVLDSDEIGMSYSGDCEEKGFHLMASWIWEPDIS